MKVVNTINEIKNLIKSLKKRDKSIGFVPTMGFLHEGHLSLMTKARKENDVVVVSIFVNPTQFGENEDLDTYPRDIKRDIKLTESVGVDVLFIPDIKEIYPKGYNTYVNIEGDLTKKLCGEKRPGHFKGVTTIITKLFNIVKPDKAYFGQKDAQQVVVIKKLVDDLNFDVEIITCPIVRENDGLALSSRNSYLNKSERERAKVLSKSLFEAKDKILNGERDALIVKELIISIISESVDKIDYVSIVDGNTLENLNKIEGNVLIALAVFIGKTRLIDNIILEV